MPNITINLHFQAQTNYFLVEEGGMLAENLAKRDNLPITLH